MTGVAYATSAEMAASAAPSPASWRTASHAAGHPNHSRAARGRAPATKLSTAPTPLDHASCPDKALIDAARRAWDTALTQGDCMAIATRRSPSSRRPAPSAWSWIATPRHRARFRAGEIQEAGRRRLSQDRQPRVPEALRTLAIARANLRRWRPMRRPRDAVQRAGDQHRIAARQRVLRREALAGREVARGRLRHKIVFNKWTLGADFLAGALKVPASAMEDKNFDLLTHLAFRARTSTPPMCISAAAMTLEGAPFLKPNITPCSTAPTPAAHGQALSLGRVAYPHDWRRRSRSSPGRSPRPSTCQRREHRDGGGLFLVLAPPLKPMRSSARLQLSQPAVLQLISGDDEDDERPIASRS